MNCNNSNEKLKKFSKYVDFPSKPVYNSRACKISDEVRCGYNLWKHWVGGNSYGVCRGLDQGGKLFKIIRPSKDKKCFKYMKQSNFYDYNAKYKKALFYCQNVMHLSQENHAKLGLKK